jgi:dienelactone hydrolase
MKSIYNKAGWLCAKAKSRSTANALLTSLLFFCLLPADAAENIGLEQKISFLTEDKFVVGANYYPGVLSGGGVLLLHDCLRDSKSYAKLAQTLASYGVHTLALDFRGFGVSVSDAFSVKKIKSRRKNLASYKNEMAALTAYWDEDASAAFAYLRNKVDKKKQIAIVGSGCSATQVVGIAEKMHVNSMVLITPKMSYGDKERYKNLLDYPSYFISSAQHTETNAIATELFEWNGSSKSKMQIFKGDRLDFSLLRSSRYLEDDIALWLKSNLAK